MKLTKKIIVAVLALALLASCFVSAAFAVDTQDAPNFTAEGITKLDDILEYYACDDYIAENFEDESDKIYGDFSNYDVDYTGDFNYSLPERYFELYDCMMYFDAYYYIHETKLGVVANPTDPDDKVLSIDLGVDDIAKYARSSADGKAWTEKVFFTFDVYFDESFMSNGYFDVQIKLEGKSTNTVLKFDFGYGDSMYNEANPGITGPVVWYAPWDARTNNFSTEYATLEGFEPKFNTWYSVTVSFNAEDDVCSFDIVEGGENVAGTSYDIPGAAGISAFECMGIFQRGETTAWMYMEDYDNPIHALMYLDDVEIYEGSYKRTPSEKETIAKTTLKEIAEFYNSEACSAESKLLIADVFYELLGYDEASILGYVEKAWEYVNLTYVNEIVSRIEKIDATRGYYDRVKYIEEEVVPVDGKVKPGVITELIGVPEEKIAILNASREAYAAELAALETIKDHSEGYIAAIGNYDPANKNYDDIVGYYNEALKDEYKLRSPEYVGVAEAEAVFEKIAAKYDRMIADTTYFVDVFEDMMAAPTFGPFYTLYKEASVAFYKYDEMAEFVKGMINPDLETATNAKLMEAVNTFIEIEPMVEAKAAECEAFNTAVLKASSSDYYPSFIELIDAAEDAFAVISDEEDEYDYVKDYKGINEGTTIEDTRATLDALKAASADKMTATDLYIVAVNAIDAAEGFYAKREAVKAAVALKAAGDNLAVKGVLEANIKLTAYEAEVNEQQGNSESVIALVAKLEAAKTISERRDLIREINQHVAGVANDYEGVAEAVATFNTLVAEFNADVAAINVALQNAIKNVVKF